MKKILGLLLLSLLVLSLVSCDSSPSSSEDATTEDASARLAYLQALVGELNASLLSLRQELYLQRVQYETRLEALESSVRDEAAGDAAGGNSADEVESFAAFSYVLSGGEATVTGYKGRATSLAIPATLGGCPVVAIGERALAGNASLRAVVLPEGLRSVGWFAFSGCVSLESVTLPASVESIAYGAFDSCHRSLTLCCPRESYARQYALSYGFAVEN